MIKGITPGIGLTISGSTSMEPYISPDAHYAFANNVLIPKLKELSIL